MLLAVIRKQARFDKINRYIYVLLKKEKISNLEINSSADTALAAKIWPKLVDHFNVIAPRKQAE